MSRAADVGVCCRPGSSSWGGDERVPLGAAVCGGQPEGWGAGTALQPSSRPYKLTLARIDARLRHTCPTALLLAVLQAALSHFWPETAALLTPCLLSPCQAWTWDGVPCLQYSRQPLVSKSCQPGTHSACVSAEALSCLQGHVMRWRHDAGLQNIPAAEYISSLERQVATLRQQVG